MTHTDDAPSKKRAALSLLATLGCLALLSAGMAVVPAIWVGNKTLTLTDAWNNIEVDLSTLPSQLPGRVTVLDSSGNQYATFYAENRVPLDSLDQVSPHLIDAVLAVEDAHFYEHGPIDVRGTLRAFMRNQVSGSTQGGSTITQQYIKNLRLSAAQDSEAAAAATETSLRRKIVELKWAAELEQVMTKDEILLGYLNVAYFGNGTYGVGAASQYYFGVTAADLTVPQAALLAGMLKNPTGYDPLTKPDSAIARRATALGRMVSAERISPAEADTAGAAPLGAAPHPLPNGCTQSDYPYYCEWVKSVLLSDPAFGNDPSERESNLYQGGFVVHTALDPKAMAAAQQAVDAALTHDNQAVAALAVVEPGTGHTLALAQSRDFSQTQVIYPVQATVQPGSTFKPITYAAALEAGFLPTDTLASGSPYSPTGMNAPSGGFKNVDGRGRGQIDAATAIKFSVNTWFVRLIERTGTEAVADMAYRLGMSSMNPATRQVGSSDASLTLGAFETSPLDVASVYATIAANGVHCRPLPITTVTSSSGGELPSPDPHCEQVIEPSVAATVSAAMTGTFTDGGTAEGLDLGRPAAGKTGTTNDFGATWFAGFTPQASTAVWVGDPRGPSYPLRDITAYGAPHERLYGATVAGPIWRDVMTQVMSDKPVVPLATPGPLTASGREVPDVRGLDVRAAISSLQDAGFTISIAPDTEDSLLAKPNAVTDQAPKAGARLANGETITLTLSRGSDTDVSVSAPPE